MLVHVIFNSIKTTKTLYEAKHTIRKACSTMYTLILISKQTIKSLNSKKVN